MRLVKVARGKLSLTQNFVEEELPPYAILSHTWGEDSDEVTFKDMESARGKSKRGYKKIEFCGRQAEKDGLQHFWVDTCCIDKTNNTELAEAITSMFRWYQNAIKCYVYLSDVPKRIRGRHGQTQQTWQSAFRDSRWFTRGWTLQELLAPKVVNFFSRKEEYLGDKDTLKQQIHEITEIPISALDGSVLSDFSVDERLQWAAKRQTKRREDRAYCLLGIFEVFIPLIYGEGDNAFLRLKDAIDMRSIAAKKMSNLTSYNKYFAVSQPLSHVFTGRDADLQRLTTAFAPGQPSLGRQQRRFVLFGLGGSGKTQICLKYVQEQRERYWGIFWVDASTEDSIKQAFTQMARLLQVDEKIDDVKRQLANTSHTWLLVIDNADDRDLSLSSYFPAGERGDVIITSRNPGHQHYHTVGCQEIGQLSLDDSVSLLTKTIYGATSLPQETGKEGKKIVEALGFLALAIVQAGAYIRETSSSLSDYLETYERRKRNVLQYLPKHEGTDYQYSVYTTWQVSIDRIESRRDAVSDNTLRLLRLLGFYHHDRIPVHIFYSAWHQSEVSQVPDYLPWQDKTSDFFEYRLSVQASIGLLASFSLVTQNTDTSLTLHPLVHGWCRDRMSGDEHDLSYRRALSLLAGAVNWEFETADYAFRRTLVSHVHELLRLREAQNGLGEEDKMQAWPTLALVLGENGWTRRAIQLLEKVLELQKSKLGEDHPDTLRSMSNLANRYSEAGRGPEALQLSEKVLELQKSKLGEDHPDTLMSTNNLAIRYGEAGRGPEALQLSEEVLELQKSKLGEDHPDTLRSMSNLTIRYSEAGRGPEALQLSEKVLKLRKSKLGEDHPDTLRSMSNLAIRYSEAGRGPEALQMSEKVLKLRKSKLGEDHPDTLMSMNNLAIRYGEAGRGPEALQLSEVVLELQKRKLGEDHPDTLRSMNNLANRYSEAGRGPEALQLSEKVLKLRKSKLGEDHPDTLMSMSNLAIDYSEAGRGPETLQLSEKVLKLRKSKLGEDHPDTLMSMNNLAIRYGEAGRGPEALQLSEVVLELQKRKLGEDHPDTLMSMNNLAIRYSEAGRGPEALQLSEEVVELRKSKLGEDHPDTLMSMYNLAIRYSEAGRGPEALQLSEEVLELRKSKLGEDHPDTLRSMQLQAYILEKTREEPTRSAEPH